MNEKKYKVVDKDGILLVSNMSLEMALLFIKAFTEKYYNEKIYLKLIEIKDNEE